MKIIIYRTSVLLVFTTLLFISHQDSAFLKRVEDEKGNVAKADPSIYDLKKSNALFGLTIQKENPPILMFIRFIEGDSIRSQAVKVRANMFDGILIFLSLLLFILVVKYFIYDKKIEIKLLELKINALEFELEIEELKQNRIRRLRAVYDDLYLRHKDAEENESKIITDLFPNQTLILEYHRCRKYPCNWNIDRDDAGLKKGIEELIGAETIYRYLHHLKNFDIFPFANFIDLITIMVKQKAYRGGFDVNVKPCSKVDSYLIGHPTLINYFYYIADVFDYGIKPAKGTMVSLEFRIENQFLVVTVEGNAHGESLMASNGIGFMYSYDCNYPLNGKLIMDSTLGEGTTLMIYTPLTH